MSYRPLLPIAGVALLLATLLTGCASGDFQRVLARIGLSGAPTAPVPTRELPPEVKRGLDALGTDDVDGAITAWDDYLKGRATDSVLTRNLYGYLTLLRRESAKRYARRVVADEQRIGDAHDDPTHIALLPFRNESAGASETAAAKPFNRAIMAMVATDLSQVPGLTVLERDKIEALLQEIRLGDSGLVNPAYAARAGRLLGAGSLVAGSVFNQGKKPWAFTDFAAPPRYSAGYSVHSAVFAVDDARLLGTQQAEGTQADYFVLEKEIVHGILATLGIKQYPKAVDHVHTRSWEAYARFTMGLGQLADNHFDAARKAFYEALEFDPDFAMAEMAYLCVPKKQMSVAEIHAEMARE